MNVRLLLLPGLAAVVAVAIWRATAVDAPACTWRIGTGTEIRQGRNYDELPAESPIRLSYTGPAPRHLYVFGHSAEDGTLLLFPSPDLEGGLQNPLPAGHSVLPGTHEGKELAWTSRSGVLGVTTLLAVAAEQPVPELEALVPKVRRWSNSVFPDRSMQVTKPAGVEPVTGPPRSALPEGVLRRAADLAITDAPNGPMQADAQLGGVWLASWKFVEKKKQ